MLRTRAKPNAASATPSRSASDPGAFPEVLTLAEAAAYLRVSERDLLPLTQRGVVPARQVGAEWRFLKDALQEWLRGAPAQAGKEALLSMAGAFKDDPFLDEIVRDTYRRRGRPITENGT
jgi:excisionase family DNA binding protein